MKKTVAALSLAFASAGAQAAPLVDFWAGAYSWDTSYEGTVSAQPLEIDLSSDLQLEDEMNNVIWAAFEHPVPVIPNVQVKRTTMSTSGNGVLTQDYTFAGETISASGSVESDLVLDHTDFTAYWGLPLPVLTLDFGLNVRKFDGELKISDTVSVLDAPVPMLFARAGAELPFTGLAIMGEANYVGYGDTNHMDYQIVLRYTLPMIPVLDVNLEGGYRSFQLNIDPTDFDGDADDLNADIDMSGFYLGVSFHL